MTRLRAQTADLIDTSGADVVVSSVSGFEIATMKALGRLEAPRVEQVATISPAEAVPMGVGCRGREPSLLRAGPLFARSGLPLDVSNAAR